MKIAERTARWPRERRVLLRASRAAWRLDHAERERSRALAPGTQTFSPEEGKASPQTRRGPTSQETPGSRPLVARTFSPARLNAVGAGPPAPRGRAEPACTT